ncbi:SDR family NAD(P)-dependent oxidoreductase [Amorphus sp. 3PC139-8]|uniref:SDR family NAD(P)-dependent oxidoreductase n=1 Tax=Amorphus sp. 3PC139-8 TaxID=2735676 RepID=UPI00345D166E
METSAPSTHPNVALVIGGGGDLGRATALRLARTGAAIALVDNNLANAEQTLSDLGAAGGHGVALQADVTSHELLKNCLDEVERTLGGLTVLVNCAGIEGAVAAIADYPESVFDQVMAVNVKGTFLAMKAALPRMTRRGYGSVVNVASTSSIRARGGLAGYVASKHAVLGLTRVAALDVAGSGVRVNAVLPGPIEGRMIQSIEQQASGGIVRAGRATHALPEEIANTIAFLASDEASHMNGAALVVDAGSTLL